MHRAIGLRKGNARVSLRRHTPSGSHPAFTCCVNKSSGLAGVAQRIRCNSHDVSSRLTVDSHCFYDEIVQAIILIKHTRNTRITQVADSGPVLQIELTVMMPCLNEAETLAICIRKARSFLERSGINGEILISDNGSTDGSQEIAYAEGARVVNVPRRGYGAALLGGIDGAQGKYIIMGDADDSYDFSALDPYVERLRDGADVVMGNRFRGGIAPGAMPFLHRYLGNPVLSWLGRLFFSIPTGDFHCGLRGFSRDRIRDLNLRTTGMEFASEMIVRASLAKYRIDEVPTT